MQRPYQDLSRQLAFAGDREQRMRALVDALWEALAATGVSWVGFYLYQGNQELVLGPSRDKPACSPIGLHGACGRAFTEGRALVVRDVADLGENYVACDPRDRSELVIPLFEPDGTCWGVLDLDSFDIGAFDETDIQGLHELFRAAGLTSSEIPPGKPIVV